MKKVLAIMLVLVLVFSAGVMAKAKVKVGGRELSSDGEYLADRGMGIGLEGGWSNGLVFKTWVGKTSAIQLDLNWYYGWGMGLGAAYLIHNFDIIEISGCKLPLYFGIKAWISMIGSGLGYGSSSLALGVQVPLGIDWIPRDYPIDIYLQFEPGLAIVPGWGMGWGPGGSAGIRYWFN